MIISPQSLKLRVNKKRLDEKYDLIDKQIAPKIFQHILVSFLKNKKKFTADFLNKIRSFHREGNIFKDIARDLTDPDRNQQFDLDCQKGCNYCCQLKVMVAAPEFKIIVEYFYEKFSKKQQYTFVNRLKSVVAEKERTDVISERFQIKCTFLIGDKCAIYPVRPLTCRAWNSLDKRTCKAYLNNQELEMPVEICHYAAFDVIKRKVIKVLEICGYDTPEEELNIGLLSYLKNTNN